jgi:hypothetical protein
MAFQSGRKVLLTSGYIRTAPSHVPLLVTPASLAAEKSICPSSCMTHPYKFSYAVGPASGFLVLFS